MNPARAVAAETPDAVRPAVRWLALRERPRHRYLFAVLLVAAATGVSSQLFRLGDLENLIMAYLLAVVLAAVHLGLGPALFATTAGFLTFLYLFVPHYYSLVPEDLYYLPTFAIMVAVASIVSALTSRLRSEALATEGREQRSRALYELSRDLAAADSREAVAEVVDRHARLAFGRPAVVVVADDEPLTPLDRGRAAPPAALQPALRQALVGARAMGCGEFLVHPLVVAGDPIGLLCIDGLDLQELSTAAAVRLLGSFANNAAVAVHRLLVRERAQSAERHVEEERMRNVMLSSVSHDLRTPLASITGAVTTLLDDAVQLDEATRVDLMQSIREDADALERQVRNLLDLTRLESGGLEPRADWHLVEEIVGCALQRVDGLLRERTVVTRLDPSLPLVFVDAVLVEQLLVNLLENAARCTPAGTPIEVEAERRARDLHVRVLDRGPGVPESERERVFEKFYRGSTATGARGAGLGLAICRAVAQLHGGSIEVRPRDGGGAVFEVVLQAADGGPSSFRTP